jgi:deazaflavin-dependent oxidoreductase (nitroreductase family)
MDDVAINRRADAMSRDQYIDITTIGRRSGLPRRIELSLLHVAGRLVISGLPDPRRRRAWLLNLEAEPRFTLHLKGIGRMDLAAMAREVTDEAERRAILAEVAERWGRTDLEAMVRHSPLIEVLIEAHAREGAA